MTGHSKSDYIKTVTFNTPEYMPVIMGFYPEVWDNYGAELEEHVLLHPNLFPDYKKGDYLLPVQTTWQFEAGKHFDHWGCEWDNIVPGHDAICIGHPIKDLNDVHRFPMPSEDMDYLEHGLMFLRLTYLRGYEECMIDFFEERPEFFALIDKVLEYNMRIVHKVLAAADPDDPEFLFMDDLGMQTGLPTGPEKWRKILKPCFAKLMKPVKDQGKFIKFHADGCIYEIIPDLKDCGVDLINPQFRANGLDNLKAACCGTGRNKIAVLLDLDRQLYPFATPSELEDHVMLAVETLGSREGGLMLYAEIMNGIPLENIVALMHALEKARVHFAK